MTIERAKSLMIIQREDSENKKNFSIFSNGEIKECFPRKNSVSKEGEKKNKEKESKGD